MIRIDSALDFLGGIPDRAFVRAARFLRRGGTTNDAGAYLRSLAYYRRFRDKGVPRELFGLPRTPPLTSVIGTTSYGEGLLETRAFASGYRVKNPAVKSRFERNAGNRTAYLHLWRHGGKPRPLVLCLHGFLMGNVKLAERMFAVRRLFAAGVDVGLLVLPHHGERADSPLRQDFVVPDDVPLFIESFAQAQHDLHAAMLVLRGEGYAKIGLIGASLGGYVGAYYLVLSAMPDFLFAVVPAARLDDYLMPRPGWFPFPVTPEMSTATAEALELVAPENFRPLIPLTRVAAVVHGGDKVNDAERTFRWIKSWGVTRVTRIAGGHWLHFDRKARGRAWYAWLKESGFIP